MSYNFLFLFHALHGFTQRIQPYPTHFDLKWFALVCRKMAFPESVRILFLPYSEIFAWFPRPFSRISQSGRMQKITVSSTGEAESRSRQSSVSVNSETDKGVKKTVSENYGTDKLAEMYLFQVMVKQTITLKTNCFSSYWNSLPLLFHLLMKQIQMSP